MADDKIKGGTGVVDSRTNTARQGTGTVSVNPGSPTTMAHGEAQKPPAYVPTGGEVGDTGLGAAAAKLKAQKKPDSAKKVPITEIPSYDAGTDYVPNDQVAQLHQGEAVVPADQNPSNPNAGAGVTGAQQALQEQQQAPIQGAPAQQSAPAPQQPKSLLGRIAQAVVDHTAGAVVRDAHKPDMSYRGQQARANIAATQARTQFESAQAASTWADVAMKQATLDAMPRKFQEGVREADQKSVEQLISKGRTPRMILPDDSEESLNSMKSELARGNGGVLPGITLLHYGSGYAVYTSDQLAGNGLLDSINRVNKITSSGEMTQEKFNRLTPAAQSKMAADALQLLNHPSAIRGEAPAQTIARYKAYLTKAQSLPDADPDKADLVKEASDAVNMLQSGHDQDLAEKMKLALTRSGGVPRMTKATDSEGNEHILVLQNGRLTDVTGQVGDTGEAPSQGGAPAVQQPAQKSTQGTQKPKFVNPSMSTGMFFGTSADGRQVAGTMQELRQAGVQGVTKLPTGEQEKVSAARQLIGPDGLFNSVAADIKALEAAGKLGVVGSRWSDFLAGKVGSEPEFQKLRTDMGLLSTRLMQAHVGLRGSHEMLEHFRGLADYRISDAATLKKALGAEYDYAHERAMLVGGGK